jgi:hypothetical protein
MCMCLLFFLFAYSFLIVQVVTFVHGDTLHVISSLGIWRIKDNGRSLVPEMLKPLLWEGQKVDPCCHLINSLQRALTVFLLVRPDLASLISKQRPGALISDCPSLYPRRHPQFVHFSVTAFVRNSSWNRWSFSPAAVGA